MGLAGGLEQQRANTFSVVVSEFELHVSYPNQHVDPERPSDSLRTSGKEDTPFCLKCDF